MGTSSSQVRLLSLTSRKHDISRELMTLSRRKQEMTREAKEASQEYNDSFNVNIFKWSSNGGATYTDITYSALMTPTAGVSGATTPILLTDNDGKIVVDDSYKRYAEMISPYGQPGGDWESNRITILEAVTGIDGSILSQGEQTRKTLDDASSAVDKAEDDVVKWKNEEIHNMEYKSNNEIAKLMPSNIYDAYKNGTKIKGITSAESFKTIVDSIKSSMKNWLSDEDYTMWETSCDKVYESEKGFISSQQLLGRTDTQTSAVFTGTAGNVDLDAKELLNRIIKTFVGEGGDARRNSSNDDIIEIGIRDRSTNSDWTKWKAEMDSREAIYNAAVSAEMNAVDTNNLVYEDQAQRNKITFYDKLFTAIAEQGWVYDDEVSKNSSYLNEMLQNNAYNLTLMSVNADYEAGSSILAKKNKYDYTVGSVYYNDNVIKVNDSSVRSEALAVYENKKAEINEKESRIDVRMEKLKSELEAINNMIKGVEAVRDKNTETYMGIFA